MYIPEHFEAGSQHDALMIIENYNFATLICQGSEIPEVSLVPLRLAGSNPLVLEGHLAIKNPMVERVRTGAAVSVIFLGPHAYISPTWYESPGQVPTWNYAAIEVNGRFEALESRDQARQVVEDLADKHEHGKRDPWIPDYAESMLDQILGFRIIAHKVHSKFKLSQNRSRRDLCAVAAELESGTPEQNTLARLMLSSQARD